MISAIDTNILLDIARPNPDFVDAASEMIALASTQGSLVISSVVHSELAAHFPSVDTLDEFLRVLNISYSPLAEGSTWQAGQA